MNIVRCSKNAHAIGALQVKKNQTKQNNMRDLFKLNKGTLSCFDLKLNQEIVRVSFASVPHYDFTHHTADIYYDVCTFIKLCSCIAHCLMINLSNCVILIELIFVFIYVLFCNRKTIYFSEWVGFCTITFSLVSCQEINFCTNTFSFSFTVKRFKSEVE